MHKVYYFAWSPFPSYEKAKYVRAEWFFSPQLVPEKSYFSEFEEQ